MNFKMARIKAGLSQTDVASILGLSSGTVSQWETDTTAPTAKNLVRVAKLYGVSVDYLLKDSEIKERARNTQCSNEDSPTP